MQDSMNTFPEGLTCMIDDPGGEAGTCCNSCTHQADSRRGSAVAGTAAATSLTAVVACSACCVLPLAVPAVLATSAGGLIAWLAAAHFWITALAAAVVLGAWAWLLRRSLQSKAKPNALTLMLMGVATLALGLALLRPYIEPAIIRLLLR